jgi:hypothetical protein
MVENLQAYYLIPGALARVIQDDHANGMSEILLAGILTPLWTYTKFLTARPIQDTYGVVETPDNAGLERAAINQDEFSRAEWFWKRRPKVLCETLIFYFCYIVVFCCLLYLVPKNIPSFLLWFVAGVCCALVDCVHIDQWRNEYKSSIKRVIVHRSER